MKLHFATIDPFPNPDAFTKEITRRICDPGTVLKRGDDPEDSALYESVQEWSARAVANMFQSEEASDGSAQPASGVSEMRDLFNAAKGVTPDQLELQLARGHLREASRAFEALRAENNQLRNFLRVAGDLLGRADADPIKLAQKVEAGIIAANEARQTAMQTVTDLEREADKARRVIAGNVQGIEFSGSLLDMLNVLIERFNEVSRIYLLTDQKRNAAEAQVEHLREKAALHTESNGMLAQERDRAQAALAGLVKIIDKAGLMNLSNGVELGQTSWYVKANDSLEFARTQLPACKKCGAKSAELEDGLCGNCAPL